MKYGVVTLLSLSEKLINMNKSIFNTVEAVFLYPVVVLYYLLLPKAIIELIKSDMQVSEMPHLSLWSFSKNFCFHADFRSVVYIRLKWRRRFWGILKPGIPTFYNLTPNIGHSMYIQHGFATIVYAEKIGHHFFVNQQVTIGYGNSGKPTIGNYVQVRAGAKVIGNITIGDDVIIGANAVVTKDVPSHSVVVGIPAHTIKTRSSLDEPWQYLK